jgi:fructokinase
MARIPNHGFGQILRDAAEAEGVDLSGAPAAAEPTTLAVVSLDGLGLATYDFYLKGTADWQWSASELRRLPDATAVIHYGSIASWTPPGSKIIDQVVTEMRARRPVLVSYDPNVRAPVLGSPARGRPLIERSVRRAHVVKASREDLDWLYAARPPGEVAALWLASGPSLVVVTDGADGAIVYRRGADPLRRPGRPVEVVDTIGAGDAFSAGLLSGLVRRGVESPEELAALSTPELADVVDEAVLVSSLTCERAGADPPRLGDLGFGSRPLTPADFVGR